MAVVEAEGEAVVVGRVGRSFDPDLFVGGLDFFVRLERDTEGTQLGLDDSELAEPLEQLRIVGRRARNRAELFHRLAEDGGGVDELSAGLLQLGGHLAPRLRLDVLEDPLVGFGVLLADRLDPFDVLSAGRRFLGRGGSDGQKHKRGDANGSCEQALHSLLAR